MKRKMIETVKDFETWQNVRAYGTYEDGNGDNEIWSLGEKLYRLCFRELPSKVQKEVIEAYRLS